jgi:hypothetical protein
VLGYGGDTIHDENNSTIDLGEPEVKTKHQMDL